MILGEVLGPVYSNIPLRQGLGLPAPAGAHVCLDLGEEEYTEGRPHPMIDPAARREIMREQAFGPDVAAVLLNVVLGYGSHPDPAGEIAATCADIVAGGAAVVCYVLGARADHQGLDRQRAKLAEAGAIVTESAAQAARTAAAIAPAFWPALARDGENRRRPSRLVTYSVKPRGGVVHTLALAEALHAAGYPVRVIALGDPAAGFFRPVAAPFTIIEAPASLPTLEERVFANVDALTAGLGGLAADFPILHTQDCISARAAARVRDAAAGPPPVVVRTVHHVDDFTSPSLIDCQRQAIVEPDRILVVSERWREILAEEYGTSAEVVHNGVDVDRFRSADPGLAVALRQRAGAAGAADAAGAAGAAGRPLILAVGGRPLILAVGGIEPRKGSDTLMAAVAELRRSGRAAGTGGGGRPFVPGLPGVPGPGAGLAARARPAARRRRGAARHGPGRRTARLVRRGRRARLPIHQGGLGPGRAGGDERRTARGGLRPARLPRVPAAGPGRPDGAGGRRGRAGRGARRSPRRRRSWPAGSAQAGDQVCARFTWERCAAEHQRIYAGLKWR